MGAKERRLIHVPDYGTRSRPSEFGRNLLRDTLLETHPVAVDYSTGGVHLREVRVQPVFEGDSLEHSTLPSVPNAAAFKGKRGEQYFVAQGGDKPQVLLVGMGKREEATAEEWRRAVAIGVRKAEELHEPVVGIQLTTSDPEHAAVHAQAIAEGAVLAAHRFHLKTDEKRGHVSTVDIEDAYMEAGRADGIRKAIERGRIMAAGQNIARVTGGMPANIATTISVAEAATALAGRARIRAAVIPAAGLDELGMGGIWNVGKGSDTPPCMVELSYTPSRTAEGRKRVVLVGKGITFDSGGINIKPSADAHIEKMHMDKCGASAVLGAMVALAELAPNIEVIGLMMMAENMLSGRAQRPGDVIRMYNGLTVDVGNTDAEGRLVLGDGLAFGVEQKPDLLISIATLTGAIIIGLGATQYAGLFTDSDRAALLLTDAGKSRGELLHRMPFGAEYDAQIRSELADAKNIGGRPAGASTAARFLSKFAEGAPAYAHLDIAGPGLDVGDLPYLDKALAPGFGARLLTEAVMRFAEQ